MISSPHYRISASPLLPTDHTAVSFSNWWRTSSVSGLTGVLSVQIASVFVTVGRGRTTYSRVTILACARESKLATQHLKRGVEIRRPKKKRNLQNDTRIKARIARYDAGAYDKLQFLRAISHSLGYTAPGFSLKRSTATTRTTTSTSTSSSHRRRLHQGNRELRPGTHARTGANVAFCPGTFHVERSADRTERSSTVCLRLPARQPRALDLSRPVLGLME